MKYDKPWEVRVDPRDPNAYDVYELGSQRKVAHLPWCSKREALLIANAPLLLNALRVVLPFIDSTEAILPENGQSLGRKVKELITLVGGES